jgi:hypothetical protein
MTAGTAAAAGGSDDAGGNGVLAHEASNTAMAIIDASRVAPRVPMDRFKSEVTTQGNAMSLLLIEALGALLLFVFIVWWTMFSGRKKGELKDDSPPPAPDTEAESDKK